MGTFRLRVCLLCLCVFAYVIRHDVAYSIYLYTCTAARWVVVQKGSTRRIRVHSIRSVENPSILLWWYGDGPTSAHRHSTTTRAITSCQCRSLIISIGLCVFGVGQLLNNKVYLNWRTERSAAIVSSTHKHTHVHFTRHSLRD